ncbi:hypothetical protein H112_03876 [Trichophyton rubrum D6]|uniref:Uncharacterized protein n=4 Tax=Trichophyton TaxID=5550 RepID=A0A178EY98_TRIRU|nr:uncharacterized protein TERG_08855 [Trichophyton rubrum CBS 118892]EZF23428.1 hypothetical protein H100_03884 [Trichophyton rubrum MR850]EZF42586.1 hypothetical protein H102_03871 [Trichophyton rubrum CBS 100081]EZF53202.1 hypothetical protein H103_03885 [Trichophyton rubrum CBS 288.86]EZF63870.1 hypothetical protein H104_03870 [Trichophyton rubrum CBS 289.86]EZF74190.1 hypothetical protein H105_03898 [Trichophyton soudanense CBS 452.61]EZF85150.1 hypothetical protein H110_03877 [Trichophy
MNSNMLAKRFAAVQKGILSALELKARYKLTPKQGLRSNLVHGFGHADKKKKVLWAAIYRTLTKALSQVVCGTTKPIATEAGLPLWLHSRRLEGRNAGTESYSVGDDSVDPARKRLWSTCETDA